MQRFAISFVVMFIIDMLWIAVIAKTHYFKAYGHVLRLEAGQLLPVWWAVIIVYLALVFGLNYFALVWSKDSITSAMVHAVLFGLIVYAVYDFTCLALFKDWPIGMTIIDCIWGGVLCGATAGITFFSEKLIG